MCNCLCNSHEPCWIVIFLEFKNVDEIAWIEIALVCLILFTKRRSYRSPVAEKHVPVRCFNHFDCDGPNSLGRFGKFISCNLVPHRKLFSPDLHDVAIVTNIFAVIQLRQQQYEVYWNLSNCVGKYTVLFNLTSRGAFYCISKRLWIMHYQLKVVIWAIKMRVITLRMEAAIHQVHSKIIFVLNVVECNTPDIRTNVIVHYIPWTKFEKVIWRKSQIFQWKLLSKV